MKKKLLSLAIMAMAATLAQAQAQPGKLSLKPMVGVTVSTLSDADVDLDALLGIPGAGTIEALPKVGFVIGGEVEWQANPVLALSAGLTYSTLGCRFDEFGIHQGSERIGAKDIKLSLNYLNIPIMANFYVAKGLALKVGLQPQILIKAKEQMTVYAESGGMYGSVDLSEDDLNTNDFALSLPIGLSYEINNIVFDARYAFGLTDVYDDSHNKCSTFQFTVGYRFH